MWKLNKKKIQCMINYSRKKRSYFIKYVFHDKPTADSSMYYYNPQAYYIGTLIMRITYNSI